MTTELTTRPVSTMADLPRPRHGSIAGWLSVWRNPEAARKQFAALGERFVLTVPLMPPMFWTTSPDDVRAVFQDKTRALSFGTGLRRLAPHEIIFGERIMEWWASPDHTDLRRKIAPAFMGKALAGYESVIEEVAQRVVRDLPTDAPVRFHSHARTLAREVIMSVVFGVTDPDRRARLSSLLQELDHLGGSRGMAMRYATSMILRGRWLPYPGLDRVLAALDQITYDEMAARRTTPAAPDRRDCLAIFLRIQDSEDGLMDDEMIAGFMRLLLVAGFDTTAATLAWVVESLVRHPVALERLEQTQAQGDDTYLDAVITETLRLRPTIPFTVRAVTRDVVVNDVFLSSGSMIFLYINGIHRRADLYPDADQFKPERFLDTTPDPHHWLPFGGGINRCLGGNMAMFEARVLMRTILREIRLETTTSPAEEQKAATVLLVPRDGTKVRLTKRVHEQATP